MANELRVTGSLNFNKNNASLSRTLSIQVTVAGSRPYSDMQNIGTSDETLALGSIGTIGFVCFRNIDATNYIDIGADGSSYPIRLLAGEIAGPLRWNGAAIHAKANNAACDLQYDIVEA